MSRNRGRRCDDTPKLNKKKVLATIIAIIVIIMIIVSFKKLLTQDEINQEVSSLTAYFSAYENGKWGVIDNKGNKIIDTTYDDMIVIPDKNEEMFICTYGVDYNTENFQTKVLNAKGEEILKEYSQVKAIENTDGKSIWYENNVLIFKENGKYGLINFDGKKILEPEYDNIYALTGFEKSVIVEKNGKKGLVSTSMGEVIIPPEYADITNLSNTYDYGYIVKNEANKFGVIKADKTKVLDLKYDEIKKVVGKDTYVVVENGKLEIVDNKGNVILNSGFDSVVEIESNDYIITRNGKYGVIDKTGKDIIPAEYEEIKVGCLNSFVAKKNGKYGVIDKAGSVIVDYKYNYINYIKEANIYECERDNKKTDILDRECKKLVENVIISDLNLEKGYLRIRDNGEYKYYNFKFEEKSSKEILATNTLFLVKENGKYGYINKKGEKIVDCIYDDAKEQNEYGFCAIKKDGKWGAIKSDGTIVVKPSVNLDNSLYIDFIGQWHRYNDQMLNAYVK